MDLYVHEIDTFVFSGGGPRAGPLFIGALDRISQQLPTLNYCENESTIKRVRGTSMGALVALMVSMRLTNKDFVQLMQSLSHKELFVWSPVDLVQKLGLNDGARLEKVLSDICKRFVQLQNPTFQQLYEKTQIELEVVVTDVDISVQGPVILSHTHTPDMHVLQAVMTSAAIPIFFAPRYLETMPGQKAHLCVDGAVAANFCQTGLEPERTLGFYCEHRRDATTPDDDTTDEANSLTPLLKYSEQLLRTSMRLGDQEPHRVPTIVLNSMDERLAVFQIGALERAELMSRGFQAANKFLSDVNIIGRTRDVSTQTAWP